MYRWGWEKTFYNKRKDVYFHIKIYKHVWKDHIFYIEVRIRIENWWNQNVQKQNELNDWRESYESARI